MTAMRTLLRAEGITAVRFLPAATPTAERVQAVLAQVHKAIAPGAEVDDLGSTSLLRWRRACSSRSLVRNWCRAAGPDAVSGEQAVSSTSPRPSERLVDSEPGRARWLAPPGPCCSPGVPHGRA